jgi:dipeptidyl aminopeptidase/acylaminoacyl peptidase
MKPIIVHQMTYAPSMGRVQQRNSVAIASRTRARAALWSAMTSFTRVGLALMAGAVLLALAQDVRAGSTAGGDAFLLDDYFRLQRVRELALSGDGKMIAYVTEVLQVDTEQPIRSVRIQEVRSGGAVTEVPELSEGRDFQWVPRSRELAFLSSKVGISQVFAYDTVTKHVRQVTAASADVARFTWAPSGEAVAFITRTQQESFYERIKDGTHGLLVQADNLSFYDFVDPVQSKGVTPTIDQLWVGDRSGSNSNQVNVPGDLYDFNWSSDSGWLSIVYVAGNIPPDLYMGGQTLLRPYCTSIGLFDIARAKFSVFAKGTPRTSAQPGDMFLSGKWLPDRHSILIQRASDPNLWFGDVPYPRLGVADARVPFDPLAIRWTSIDLYPNSPKLIPRSENETLVAMRLRAVDTLMSVAGGQVNRASAIKGVAGNLSQFAFSDDFRVVTFVNESLSQAPEIYVRVGGAPARQMTHLNEYINQLGLPSSTEVTWASADGTEISGWLLTPRDSRFAKPWPVLTYLHGGPGYAMPNRLPALDSGWPHPLELLALRGIAVFIPQYRGTMSFGRKLAQPSNLDAEPIDDVVTGIQRLIASGIADRDRLGIAGYSHGAWLAPMVASRAKTFRAASFAEGWSNHVTLYDLSSAEFNREVHQAGMHEPSFYDVPNRYLDLSPSLHFRGLMTPMLFETGSEATAILTLGMWKAARHFGIPAEYVIYPQSGHSIELPSLFRESAERNLDWFLFWLRDAEDPSPAKAEQYGRWHQMRDKLRGANGLSTSE